MKRNLLLMPDPAPAVAPPTETAGMQEAFDGLDTAAGNEPAVPPEPAPDKAAPAKQTGAPPAKEVSAKAASAKSAAPAKVPAPAKEPAKEPEDITRMAPKALRDAYSGLKEKLKTLEKEREEWKSKPTIPPPPADDTDRKRIEGELESERKRRTELEDHIRYVDYEKSPEYQEKYHKPYIESVKDAQAQVTQLDMTLPDGTTRQATADDFWAIVGTDNANVALKKAEEMFGSPSKATFVMAQRENVRRAWLAGQHAREEFRKTGVERVRQADEQHRSFEQRQQVEWSKLNAEAVKENDWLQPVEGDDEGNTLLEKGFETADAVFHSDAAITDAKTGQKRAPTFEERIKLNSDVRNRAAAFPRIQHQYKAAQARIAELEAELVQYQKSAPGEGEPKGDETTTEGDEIDAAFEKMRRE